MLHLIPPGLHRAALQLAHRVRRHYRRIARPRLEGVSVLASDAQERLLLVRHSYGSGAWNVPGGGCGRGEEAEVTARREMREELGVELDGLLLLSRLEETISGAPHTAHVFAAKLRGEARPDGREIVEARLFTADALPEGLSPPALKRIELWLARTGS